MDTLWTSEYEKKCSMKGLKYNSFRWRAIRLPKAICMLRLSSCSDVGFKLQLDSYLRNIVDLAWIQ